MGIKQPTDLSLQASSGKGADQICMHLWSYTRTHAQKRQTHTSKTGTHTHSLHADHLRAQSSLQGALRPVGVGAIFVGFCGKSVCESVWVSSSANVWECFITRQEKPPVLSEAPVCLHIFQPTEGTFRVVLMAVFVSPFFSFFFQPGGQAVSLADRAALQAKLLFPRQTWRRTPEIKASDTVQDIRSWISTIMCAYLALWLTVWWPQASGPAHSQHLLSSYPERAKWTQIVNDSAVLPLLYFCTINAANAGWMQKLMSVTAKNPHSELRWLGLLDRQRAQISVTVCDLACISK